MAKDQNHQFSTLTKELKREKISFSWGYPDLDTFPIDNFSRIVRKVASGNDWKDYFQYSPGGGLPELAGEIIVQKMGDFGRTSPPCSLAGSVKLPH